MDRSEWPDVKYMHVSHSEETLSSARRPFLRLRKHRGAWCRSRRHPSPPPRCEVDRKRADQNILVGRRNQTFSWGRGLRDLMKPMRLDTRMLCIGADCSY
eukprot:819038-Prymnesium_polylepis.1